MGFCPYITAKIITSSAVDGTSSTYTYSVSEYNCPQNTTCQVWDSAANDCGAKNPPAAAGGPSPTTLLTEFLNKLDGDELDLTSLGVSGDGVYGYDYMIDDPDNIPIILKAANDHQEFDETLIVNRVEGSCTVTITQPGWDSTAEWIYEVVATDSTSDFVTSLVTTSMYIVFFDGDTIVSSHQITSVDDDVTITLNLGTSDTPPLAEDDYAFIVDRKRITWQEYLDLF